MTHRKPRFDALGLSTKLRQIAHELRGRDSNGLADRLEQHAEVMMRPDDLPRRLAFALRAERLARPA